MASRITDSRYEEALKIVEAYEAQEKAKDNVRRRLDEKKRKRAKATRAKAKPKKPKQPIHALRIGDKLLQRCQQRNASITMEQVDDALFGLLFDDLIEVHKTMNDKAYCRPLQSVDSRMNNDSAAWGNHHKADWAKRNKQ